MTNREAPELDLQRGEELRYRTVADMTYDWETWENPDGSYNYISPSFERITGYHVQQLVDHPELLNEIIVPDDLTSWQEHRQTAHARHETGEVQLRIRNKNGQIRWIEHICQPIYNDQGEYLGIRASNRDINKRKLAEQALRKRDASLSEAQRIAHLGSWNWDITNNELWWSDEVYRIFGLAPQQFDATYEGFLSTIHPDDRNKVKTAVSRSLKDPKIRYDIEHRIVQPQGVQRIVHEQAEVTFSKSSRALQMIGTVQDITEQKQMENKLAKQFEEIQHLKHRLQAECTYLQEEIKQGHNFENIIGNSDALKYVLYRVEEVAVVDTPVLIMGETGTGKELIARAIHSESLRRKRPLIKVNCAALSPTLIESELFGHEKGAFTGADSRRLGRFGLADGASLFLDEISEIPLELQSKLLRVLQDGEFERLGSSKTLRTDVRIIAASNRNLQEEVKSGRFRLDLLYRINVFPLTVPSLRHRKEDIPLLVNWFVEKFNRKMGKHIESIPTALIEHLQTYDWPGNIRELENVIEQAVITTRGTTLKLFAKLDTSSTTRKPLSRPGKLADVERVHILETLEHTRWKIEGNSGAAKTLGLAPSTLRDRMKKLGIHRAPKR